MLDYKVTTCWPGKACFLLISYFSKQFVLLRFCYRKFVCVDPPVLTRKPTWNSPWQLKSLECRLEYELQRLGIMRAVIPSFAKAIAGEVVLWTCLLSLCVIPESCLKRKKEEGRRKGEETHNRFASSESRELDRTAGEVLNARAGLSSSCSRACRGPIDRSIDRRGRSRGGRAKREDSWVEKRIWNLWAARYRRSYDRFERGMFGNGRGFF